MFENDLAILSLCYDDVQVVTSGIYIVKEEGKYGVIDNKNNTLLDKKYYDIVHIGNILYCKDSASINYVLISLDNFSLLPQKNSIQSIKRISEHGYVLDVDYGRKCLVNSRGEEVLPPIYDSIWVNGRQSNKEFIKAIPMYDLRMQGKTKSEIACVVVDKLYTKADCLVAYETEKPDLQVVVTHYNTFNNGRILPNGVKAKYRLRVNGVIVGKEYDSIMVRHSLLSSNLVEVYTGKMGKMRVGLMRMDGTEVVEAEKYNFVSYIGNGITVVGIDNKFGTVVDGREVEEINTNNMEEANLDNDTGSIKYPGESLDSSNSSNEFTGFNILQNIPIAVLFKNNTQYYIGNDGVAYKNISSAFPIYQSIIDPTIYLINIYGTWLAVDKDLNRIGHINKEVSDVYKWKKVTTC